MRVAIVVPLGLLTSVAVLQIGPYLAHRRIGELDWYRTASTRAQRETAHEALAFWFGDPHDAFAILERVGDASSVPHIRAALARQRFDDNESVTCTWIHARHALERIQESPPTPP